MNPWLGLFLISLISLVMVGSLLWRFGQRLFDHSAGGRFLLAFLMATLHHVLPGIYLAVHHLPLPDTVAVLEFFIPFGLFWRLAYASSHKPVSR